MSNLSQTSPGTTSVREVKIRFVFDKFDSWRVKLRSGTNK
jgi:hypothetical protein